MHLERKENGVWCARIKLEGRWTRRSLRTKNKREAQRRLTKLNLNEEKHESVQRAVKRWLKEQEYRDLTDGHFSDLRLIGRELTRAFGSKDVVKVQRSDLLPWLQEKPRRLRLARAFFRWCVTCDIRTNDPCLGIARYINKPERMPTPRLSDNQISALLSDLKQYASNIYPLVKFLSESGVRSVDATRIRWRHVHSDRVLIKPGKGKGHTRFIPVVIDMPAKNADELVFGVTKNQLEGAWRRFKDEHQQWKGTSLHSLRVAVNSRLVEQGQEALARAMLGHSSVDMTARYVRL